VDAKSARLAEQKKQVELALENQSELKKRRISEELAVENKRLAAAQDRVRNIAKDLRLLKGRLSTFEEAYENKAFSQLETISTLSPETSQLLPRIFETYASIDISLGQVILSNDVAEFVVSIESLTRRNGSTSYASSRWKNRTVMIRKRGAHWGKFEW
jgi:hypothetical protein